MLCAESVHQHIFPDDGLCTRGIHPAATATADLPFSGRKPGEQFGLSEFAGCVCHTCKYNQRDRDRFNVPDVKKL